MERHRVYLGEKTSMSSQVDSIMDAISRNAEEFASFLTTAYGINMQENSDALKVVYETSKYLVYPGKALSPQFKLIINNENKDFTDDLNQTPTNGEKQYVWITTKEIPDTETAVEFLPNYSASQPYAKWYIDNEIIITGDNNAPDEDSILLALLTYNESQSQWDISDKRLETQFSISAGIAVILNHILSAHTACLYPADTDALTPTINGTSLSFQSLSSDDYVYSAGHIFSQLSSYTINFTEAAGWYYIYIDANGIAKQNAGNGANPQTIATAGLDDNINLVICYVYWNGSSLSQLTDLRDNYYLPTRAEQVRFSPSGNIESENVQKAIEELSDEKLARDGSQPMTGDLNMGYKSITNVQNITFKAGIGPAVPTVNKHVIQTDSKPLHLNTTVDDDKGIIVENTGEVKIQGQVKHNIDMADGYTVDGVDLSEIDLAQIYDFVVDRSGSSGPGSEGTCGLDYALDNIDTGEIVFIKYNASNYVINKDHILPAGVKFIGQSSTGVKLNTNGYKLQFSDGFWVQDVLFTTTGTNTNIKLLFGDNGTAKDCIINTDSSAYVSLGESIYINVIAGTSSTHPVDAKLSAVRMLNCSFHEVDIDEGYNDGLKYSVIVGSDFYKASLYGSYSKFIGCSTSSPGDGWYIPNQSNSDVYSQYCSFVNCEGDFMNNGHDEGEENNKPHYMIVNHHSDSEWDSDAYSCSDGTACFVCAACYGVKASAGC